MKRLVKNHTVQSCANLITILLLLVLVWVAVTHGYRVLGLITLVWGGFCFYLNALANQEDEPHNG